MVYLFLAPALTTVSSGIMFSVSHRSPYLYVSPLDTPRRNRGHIVFLSLIKPSLGPLETRHVVHLVMSRISELTTPIPSDNYFPLFLSKHWRQSSVYRTLIVSAGKIKARPDISSTHGPTNIDILHFLDKVY